MIIRMRRGSAAGWTVANPTLDPGEIGVVVDQLDANDSQLFKIGDGVTPWNDLAFPAAAGITQAQLDLILTGYATILGPSNGTDDYTALQAALTAADVAGGGYIFYWDQYKISKQLTISSHTHFLPLGKGSVTETFASNPGPDGTSTCLMINKHNGPAALFTASITVGTNSLAVTGSAPFTPDMVDGWSWVVIPGAGFGGLALTAKITGYTDSTHVTLESVALTTVSSAANCVLARATDIDIHVAGRFIGANNGLPSGPNALNPSGLANGLVLKLVRNLDVDVEVSHIPGIAVAHQGCFDGKIKAHVHDTGRDGVSGMVINGIGCQRMDVDIRVEQNGDDSGALGASVGFPGCTSDNTYGRAKGNRIRVRTVGDQTGSTVDLGSGVVLYGCEDTTIEPSNARDKMRGIYVKDASIANAVDPSTGNRWRSTDFTVIAPVSRSAGQHWAYSTLLGAPASIPAQPAFGVGVLNSDNGTVINPDSRGSYHQDVWIDSSCVNVKVIDAREQNSDGSRPDTRGEHALAVATSNLSLNFVTSLGTGLAVASAGGTVTKTAHGLIAGQAVALKNNTAGGLSNQVLYYVLNPTANTFQLALTQGGAAIAVSGDGTADVTYLPATDGYAFQPGDIVLLAGQTSALENGLRRVPPLATPTNAQSLGAAAPRPASRMHSKMAFYERTVRVVGGTRYAGTTWRCTSPSKMVVDVDPQVWFNADVRTTDSGSITVDVDLSSGGSGVVNTTDVFATNSLAVGIWKITMGANLALQTGTTVTLCDLRAIAGTATATFTGEISTAVRCVASNGSTPSSITFIATVTVAGTLKLSCRVQSGAALVYAKAATLPGAFAGATGWVAEKIG